MSKLLEDGRQLQGPPKLANFNDRPQQSLQSPQTFQSQYSPQTMNSSPPLATPQYVGVPPNMTQFAPPYSVPPGVSYGMPQVGYNHSPYAGYEAPVQQSKPFSLVKMVKQFTLNQQVEVCLRGNMWVLGIVVGALKLWDKITGGVGYDVRYTLSGESRTETFPASALRLPQYQL